MCEMDRRFDIVTIANALCVAMYLAITLGYVARHDFGFSRLEIRDGATIVAILIAALLAIDFFGKKLGKAE